jgi:hypothetical protein
VNEEKFGLVSLLYSIIVVPTMDDATPSFHTEKNREEDIFNIIFSEGPKRAVEKYLHVLNQEEGYEKFVKYLILERCEASKISQWLSWLCLW